MAAKSTNPGTQAAMIRALLARKSSPKTIVEKVQKAFPKQKPTVGYVNWLAKNAKR